MHNDSENMGLSSGTILFKGSPRLRPTSLFKAAIITMPDILPPIINGSEFELFVLGREVSRSIFSSWLFSSLIFYFGTRLYAA